MAHRRLVVFGLLGTTLDRGSGPGRWRDWRPSVGLFQHEELLIDRFELVHDTKFDKLARSIASDVAHVSPETEVRRHLIEWEDPWDFEAVYGALHDFARGYRFDTEHEDYLVHITTGTHVAQICLFLLTESRRLPGKLIQTSPSRRGVETTAANAAAGSYAIIDLDLSRYDRLATRFSKDRADGQSLLKTGIATRNANYNRLIAEIERVAVASRAPILITGATGVGKTQLARAIYALRKERRRVDGPLVEVNCATIRGDGAMSALFGHTKGAFTGALSAREGLLRQADKGVLFLDEIGELGLEEQAMLLRAIEDRSFLPVGADKPVRSAFELIAGTNRELRDAVAEGRFREDLLARIDTWTFTLPTLRERREDLAPNVEHELWRASETLGTAVRFNREALADYLAFAESDEAAWPGNFRDLGASITRMATLAPAGRIRREEVSDEIARLRRLWRAPRAGTPADAPAIQRVLETIAAPLDPFDRAQLKHVIEVCQSSPNLSAAGRALFAESRKRKASSNDADRLKKYLARFGLSFPAVAREGRGA
jgi:transcriptional regulatory protein RtcR